MAAVSSLDIESADAARPTFGNRSFAVLVEGISRLVRPGKTQLVQGRGKRRLAARKTLEEFVKRRPRAGVLRNAQEFGIESRNAPELRLTFE